MFAPNAPTILYDIPKQSSHKNKDLYVKNQNSSKKSYNAATNSGKKSSSSNLKEVSAPVSIIYPENKDDIYNSNQPVYITNKTPKDSNLNLKIQAKP